VNVRPVLKFPLSHVGNFDPLSRSRQSLCDLTALLITGRHPMYSN
jgi:hypothetical protein